MSNATPRANARAMSKTSPKPDTFETDSGLEALGVALVACDQLYDAADAADDNLQFAVQYESHWALREKINRIPATTLSGLREKARAAEFAFKHDASAECECEGSFIELSRSMSRDIAAMTTGEEARS